MKKNSKNLSDSFKQFIQYCKIKNLSEATITYYNESFRYFRKFHSDENPKSINQQVIDDYNIHLQESNISDISVNTRLRGLRAIFKFMAKNNIISPVSISLIKSEKKIKETFTEEQLKVLLKKPNIKKCSFTELRNWTIVNYLIATGNRASTVINIKISDLDFDNLLIKIKNKKGKKEALIPMSQNLAYVLHEYLLYRQHISEDEYLFVNEDNTQMKVYHLSRVIRKYNIKRGYFNGSLHIYRHTFAKLWIINGGDLFRLQSMLGHESMVTVREYVEMFSPDLQRDFEKFNPLDRLNVNRKITMKRGGKHGR